MKNADYFAHSRSGLQQQMHSGFRGRGCSRHTCRIVRLSNFRIHCRHTCRIVRLSDFRIHCRHTCRILRSSDFRIHCRRTCRIVPRRAARYGVFRYCAFRYICRCIFRPAAGGGSFGGNRICSCHLLRGYGGDIEILRHIFGQRSALSGGEQVDCRDSLAGINAAAKRSAAVYDCKGNGFVGTVLFISVDRSHA